MITLEQARKIVEDGEVLMAELSDVDARLKAFHAFPGDIVGCRAYAGGPASDTFGRGARAFVEIMPVAKTVAISALERERAKVLSKLAELGVSVPTTE